MVKLPTNKRIRLFWNFGSLLGFIFVFQVVTGLFLVFFYTNSPADAFSRVQYIIYEVNLGWIFRLFHFNGARLFFFFIFLHFFKGLYFFSFRRKKVWATGLVIFLFLMTEAFIGYVLVWAQMRFWASVVITSLLTVIPFWGFKFVFWIWGGFSVASAALKFFFVFHFLLPWLLIVILLLHFLFLHENGRTSKLYFCGNNSKVTFYPFFWLKDVYDFFFFLGFFVFLFLSPFLLGDAEMFLEADYMSSPVHIVPEWYFLFAYAILRSIPNKLLGVFFLLLSILIFFFFLFYSNYLPVTNKLYKLTFFSFLFTSVILSWLGQCLVEAPFSNLRGLFTSLYFFFGALLFFSYLLRGFIFSFMFIIILIFKI